MSRGTESFRFIFLGRVSVRYNLIGFLAKSLGLSFFARDCFIYLIYHLFPTCIHIVVSPLSRSPTDIDDLRVLNDMLQCRIYDQYYLKSWRRSAPAPSEQYCITNRLDTGRKSDRLNAYSCTVGDLTLRVHGRLEAHLLQVTYLFPRSKFRDRYYTGLLLRDTKLILAFTFITWLILYGNGFKPFPAGNDQIKFLVYGDKGNYPNVKLLLSLVLVFIIPKRAKNSLSLDYRCQR